MAKELLMCLQQLFVQHVGRSACDDDVVDEEVGTILSKSSVISWKAVWPLATPTGMTSHWRGPGAVLVAVNTRHTCARGIW